MKQMTAEFFELASAVMNSPYFYERSPSDKPKDIITFDEKRDAERDMLQEAFEHCSEYKDLRGEAKRIFDTAKQSIDEWERDENIRDRLCGDDDSLSISFDQETVDATGPSPENTSLLVEAIAQAVAAGDMKAAEKLAALGKDPDKLQAILDTAEAEEPYAEQAADEEAELPQLKKQGVKPSPFKDRKSFDKALSKEAIVKLMTAIRSAAGSTNLIPISRMRQLLTQNGYSSQGEQDQVLQQLRSRFLLSASGPEGRNGSTPEERASWLRLGSETIAFFSIRH